jgi:hypothetical protein
MTTGFWVILFSQAKPLYMMFNSSFFVMFSFDTFFLLVNFKLRIVKPTDSSPVSHLQAPQMWHVLAAFWPISFAPDRLAPWPAAQAAREIGRSPKCCDHRGFDGFFIGKIWDIHYEWSSIYIYIYNCICICIWENYWAISSQLNLIVGRYVFFFHGRRNMKATHILRDSLRHILKHSVTSGGSLM